MRRLLLVMIVTIVCAASLAAQNLPQPLRLPPGMEQTLPVNKPSSYLADAAKIQDCPEDKDNPLGLCNNVLFGGYATYLSHLSGNLNFKFFPPINNVAHFEIRHPGGLRGDDVVQRAPKFYQFPVTGTVLSDSSAVTSGDVNLLTGEVSNMQYRLTATSSLLTAYKNLNPKLTGNVLEFPGIYGASIYTREIRVRTYRFEQRPDGLLDFTFFATSFIPLGNNQGGLGDDKVRIPLPFCSSPGVCRGMEAPGTTLHPWLSISTKDLSGTSCGAACPEIPLNTTQVYAATAYYTSTGDFFHLDIPEIGGDAEGRSHLLGRVVFQFGDRYGDTVPFSMQLLVPESLLAEPPASPFPGFGVNMLGFDENLRFPNQAYVPSEVAVSADPYDFAVGAIDLRSGQIMGNFVFRGFPISDLLFAVQTVNPGRIPPDTFRYQGPASFERGANGSTIFRFSSHEFLHFDTLNFPSPDYNPARFWTAGPDAVLDPFLELQATNVSQAAVGVKTGQINEASSRGDAVRIQYSVPCDISFPNFSFEYTNSSNLKRGGTFRMKTLTSVICTNSRGSTAGSGDADVVTFAGFGSWSKDDDTHFATVQVSTGAGSRYWGVSIDGGFVSNANLKPAVRPVP